MEIKKIESKEITSLVGLYFLAQKKCGKIIHALKDGHYLVRFTESGDNPASLWLKKLEDIALWELFETEEARDAAKARP